MDSDLRSCESIFPLIAEGVCFAFCAAFASAAFLAFAATLACRASRKGQAPDERSPKSSQQEAWAGPSGDPR
eukprot:2100606-Prymnesium_polylepis.1